MGRTGLLRTRAGVHGNGRRIRAAHSPGVMGGEPQLDQSKTALSTNSSPILIPAKPSRPENMGFMGVCRISQLLGLPMALPDVDSGGVEGK